MSKQEGNSPRRIRCLWWKKRGVKGMMETCRKYNISPSLLTRWKKKYMGKGTQGLQPAYKRVDPELRALREENERLKRIVAKQALEIEIKTVVLKLAPVEFLKKRNYDDLPGSFDLLALELCSWAGLKRTTYFTTQRRQARSECQHLYNQPGW